MSCCLPPSLTPLTLTSEVLRTTSRPLSLPQESRGEFSCVIAGSPQDSGWPSSFHSQTCTYPRNWTTTVVSGSMYIHDVCVGSMTVVPLEYTMTVTSESADRVWVCDKVSVCAWIGWKTQTCKPRKRLENQPFLVEVVSSKWSGNANICQI